MQAEANSGRRMHACLVAVPECATPVAHDAAGRTAKRARIRANGVEGFGGRSRGRSGAALHGDAALADYPHPKIGSVSPVAGEGADKPSVRGDAAPPLVDVDGLELPALAAPPVPVVPPVPERSLPQ